MKEEKKLTEIQSLELEMLKEVVPFLEKNNLKYFLCAGSLLGAIRHQGFIPWDDDIDIGMPRPDYEKLIEIAKNNPYIISDELEISSIEINNLPRPFCKILNKNVAVYEELEIDKYLWIDIFPFDGLPENDKELERMFKKKEVFKKILVVKEGKNIYKNKLKYILKEIKIRLYNIFTTKYIVNKIINLGKKYKFEDSEYVGEFVWGYGPRERTKKENIELMPLTFEGIKVNGIKGYHNYLTSIYGDYMKLPPKEQRITHNIKIERIK